MFRYNSWFRILLPLLFGSILIAFPAQAAQPKSKWIRVSSDHFTVLTDTDRDKGREIAVRLEQMRTVFGQLLLKRKLNLSEPLDVIALREDKEYADLVPVRQGQALNAPGFFIAGPDRNYIVLHANELNCWLAVAHDFAHLFLNYNYPPTQPWFDEGFAEYFSSLRLENKQAWIGGDPELGITWDEDIFGNQTPKLNPPRSLTELLTAPVWLSVPDLFTMHEYHSGYLEGTHRTLFYAQSWMVVHYLLNKDKLSQTGMYFDLVENQKQPVAQAIQQAYGISAAQFDQAVKDYFKSLTPLFLGLDASKLPGTTSFNLESPAYEVSRITLGDAADIGTSIAEVPESEADAAVAEMALRMPEHRQQAIAQLQGIDNDTKTENAIAHRAMAWLDIQKKDFTQAGAELSQALELDSKDPWTHYYSALLKYDQGHASGQPIPGLANMMIDLRMVIDWDPEFAEAYNMLAVARVEGGGIHSAIDAMKPALRLNPRNEVYVLNLARIDMAGKNWDDATALLDRLKTSDNPNVAGAARKELADLPTLKKYGVPPQAQTPPAPAEPASKSPENTASSGNNDSSDDDSGSSLTPSANADQKPDRRQIKFLRGTLANVDCSKPPAAVLTVTASGKSLKLRSEDYKTLTLIGADQFSCEWQHRSVEVNYKAGGKADGDLVSLELR